MYLLSLGAGIVLITTALFLIAYGREIFIDLFTGEARRLGIIYETIPLAILFFFLITLLIYIGYHGIIGMLTVDLL